MASADNNKHDNKHIDTHIVYRSLRPYLKGDMWVNIQHWHDLSTLCSILLLLTHFSKSTFHNALQMRGVRRWERDWVGKDVWNRRGRSQPDRFTLSRKSYSSESSTRGEKQTYLPNTTIIKWNIVLVLNGKINEQPTIYYLLYWLNLMLMFCLLIIVVPSPVLTLLILSSGLGGILFHPGSLGCGLGMGGSGANRGCTAPPIALLDTPTRPPGANTYLVGACGRGKFLHSDQFTVFTNSNA
jgi:hypothetical protein